MELIPHPALLLRRVDLPGGNAREVLGDLKREAPVSDGVEEEENEENS